MKLIHNANIYTLDPQRPTASALAIDGERIVALGDDHTLRLEFEGRARLENLEGQTIIPGLTDAHIHLQNYALALQMVDCATDTRAECLRRVAERAQALPAGEWLLGHGWNQNVWPEDFGTILELDAAAPSQPVFLAAKSLHAAWVNSAALRLAGISVNTPDPPGGKLGRDAHGQPNGLLFESAMGLVYAAIPGPGETQVVQALRAAQSTLWQMGLTGAHDFDRRQCFAALQTLHLGGELRLRVLKSLPLEDLPHAAALGLRTGFGDDWLRIGSIKAFADGALGPRTAAMLQPYEGEPDNHGMLLLDAEELVEHGRAAVQNGLSLAVHAIGDRANHEVLKALAQLRVIEESLPIAAGRRPLRHRIEHVQLLHPADAGRLAQLGVIASMQPIHATSDMLIAERYWGKRADLSYALRTQLTHGATLAFGSDAPVESPNPFWGLHAAVTRRRQDGSPDPQGWYPEQRLSVFEALQGFTRGAAYAAGWEDRQGQLSPGYFADLLVLETDPFNCPAEQLYTLRPSATMVGGEWVWRG
jgi:hypothetical protein